MPGFKHAKIAVIGIGSTGCNVVDNMIDQGTQGIEFIGVSVGKLCSCLAKNQIQILDYKKSYKNEKEEKLAIDKGLSDIKKIIDGYNMVLILCDSIGDDGSWISCNIAELCKSMNILTISIVNDPLKIESKSVKEETIEFKNKLKKYSNAVIVLPSENIIKNTELKNVSISMMYSIIKDYFVLAVKSIANILIKTGEIHIVFEDLKYLFKQQGIWNVSIAHGIGKGSIKKAFNNAIKNFGPINKLNKIMFIFTFPEGYTTMKEIKKVRDGSKIENILKKDVMEMRAVIDDEIKDYNGEIRVTIIGM